MTQSRFGAAPWRPRLVACIAAALIWPAAGAPSVAAADDGVAGMIFTVAGPGPLEGEGDGPLATRANLRQVVSVAAMGDGGFLALDMELFTGWSIWRVWPDGTATTLGRGVVGPPGFRPAFAPTALDARAGDGFLVADASGSRVLAGEPDGTMRALAGTGERGTSGDGGPATAATLEQPSAVATARDGSVLIADASANRIRRITPDAMISTVAGTGAAGLGGDGGPAAAAQISSPGDVAAAADGGFYVADNGNGRVRRVDAGGTITTVAGRRKRSNAGGQLTRMQLGDLGGVAATRDGGFMVVNRNGHVLRARSSGRLARRWGTDDFAQLTGQLSETMAIGDGGPADDALIRLPNDVAEAPDGGVLIGESGGRVRYIAPAAPALLAVAAVTDRVRAGTDRSVVPFRTTRPAAVGWTLSRPGRTVARGTRPTGGRLRRIRLNRAFPPGPYVFELVANDGAAQAANRQSVFLGGRLPMEWASDAADLAQPYGIDDDDGGGVQYGRSGCRRFSSVRVDCRWLGYPLVDYERKAPTHAWIVSVRLAPFGQIFTRSYTSAAHGRPGGYKRRPRKLSIPRLVDLECMITRRDCF